MENKDCSQCKHKDMATVPYFVYEGTCFRFERSQKALIIVTVVALILACIVIVGAIVMMKVMAEVIDIYEAKQVVQNIVDTTRI